MTDEAHTPSTTRPVLLGQVASPRPLPSRSSRGASSRVTFHGRAQRISRLDARFNEAMTVLQDQVQLAVSINAADPQLVLVFEGIDEDIDISAVAQKLGLEILIESKTEIEPTDEFELTSDKAKNPMIGMCLHAVCMNQTSFDQLLTLWRQWKKDGALGTGYAPLRELFIHLADIRPWGPQDRLQSVDWDEYFAGRTDEADFAIEIELWYRRSTLTRDKAQSEIVTLIQRSGGTVISSAQVAEVGYHGIKCLVPDALLKQLAASEFDQVQLVRSANVMYLRISGQSLLHPSEPVNPTTMVSSPPPTGTPSICVFDGVPASNHQLLHGRVQVFDPDDLSSRSSVDERRHGTWVSSVVVWGDKSAGGSALARPLMVRPILVPSAETNRAIEELDRSELAPDLMWRAFRELFEAQTDQRSVGADIAIINLSVGDPASPFETIMSAWSRMVDWLSYEYGVLVVISAGNYAHLPVSPSTDAAIAALTGNARRQAVLNAQHANRSERRLMAPAESINALTVGAMHEDASGVSPVGYALDPADGESSISPVTAFGGGYRGSLKPELAADGGKVTFTQPTVPAAGIAFKASSPLGPGILVAAPNSPREQFVAGTSFAAALVTRQAGAINELVDSICGNAVQLSRRQRVAATKALLIHGTSRPDDFASDLAVEQVVGNGVLLRDFSHGCASNEAVLLYIGSLGATEEQELILPLPDGLSVREAKRIEASLAWTSPVNWRHRQYRRAALSFVQPEGAIPKLGTSLGIPSGVAKRGATTVQRQVWEFSSAIAGGQGSNLTVRVKCFEQAGGLDGVRVDYAAALSLWVAPTLNVNVYAQVRQQIQSRVEITL